MRQIVRLCPFGSLTCGPLADQCDPVAPLDAPGSGIGKPKLPGRSGHNPTYREVPVHRDSPGGSRRLRTRRLASRGALLDEPWPSGADGFAEFGRQSQTASGSPTRPAHSARDTRVGGTVIRDHPRHPWGALRTRPNGLAQCSSPGRASGRRLLDGVRRVSGGIACRLQSRV